MWTISSRGEGPSIAPTERPDETEVTVAAYAACVNAGTCSAPNTGTSCNWGVVGRDNHPVNCVDWNQATAYCAWAGKRLPTEAEWEYAARGTDGRIYPWGNTAPDCTLAVWDDGTNYGCGLNSTAPVGSRPTGASPFGALDMAGNVWEWTADWHGPYSAGAVTNPQGPPSGSRRVVRGGGWDYLARHLRASYRGTGEPGGRYNILGFRCARPL